MNDKVRRIAEFWNTESIDFDERHATEDLALWSEELEKAIGLKGKGKILDVGTGTGFLALLLAKLGYEVTGVDCATGMLEQGIKKAEELKLPVQFIESACEELPFADGVFDAVVNCRVMWTLTDPVQAVSEWKRVLKGEGRVISFMRMMNTAPNGENRYGDDIDLPLKNGSREDYVNVYQAADLREITVSELPAALSAAEDMPGWTMFVGKR